MQLGGGKRLECFNARNRRTETLGGSPWERKKNLTMIETTCNCGLNKSKAFPVLLWWTCLFFFFFLIKNQDKTECFSNRRATAQLMTPIVIDHYWMGESNWKCGGLHGFLSFSVWKLRMRTWCTVEIYKTSVPLKCAFWYTMYIGISLVLSCARPVCLCPPKSLH